MFLFEIIMSKSNVAYWRNKKNNYDMVAEYEGKY